MRSPTKSQRRTLLAGPLLLLLLVLAGCGGSSHSLESSGSSGGSGQETGSGGSTAGGAAATPAPESLVGKTASDRSTSSATNAVSPLERSVISTGQITLRSTKVASARAEVTSLVASWGGTIADEQTQSDRRGRATDSVLTLRVPTARFDAAMTALGRVGDVVHQSRTAEDVTTQVIDNRVRVRAAQRSIDAIEGLLGRATRLSDVISIETDLARRQADLDSLEQQQAWLSDQTSLSTITVHLSRTAAPPAVRKAAARGFLAGLEDGWSALHSTAVAALTVVGALLPFGLVALLVGVPLWVVVRRRRPGPAIEQS